MLTTIWTEPEFAEWMFLFATILFAIGAALYFWPSTHSDNAHHDRLAHHAPAVSCLGLALFALGFLAL